MSIPVLPKKLSAPVHADSDNEEEDPEQLLNDERDDTASEQSSSSDDDTSTIMSNDDDTDASEGEGEEGDVVAGSGGGDGDSDGEGEGEGVNVAAKPKKTKKKQLAKNTEDDDLTLLGVPHGINFDDDDEDDEDEDENEDADKDSSEYFQKLKSSVRDSYVERYHPESFSHNYDEIQTLARVVRNSAGVIVDDLHRTIPILTKYEKTRILGQRAKQLNEGAPAFINIDSTVIDGYLIAVKELEQKKTPFIIRRPLPNGGSEYWRIQDLEIL
jgi:DNA-directed RNA polymerase I, II, and III subunit RPABC2